MSTLGSHGLTRRQLLHGIGGGLAVAGPFGPARSPALTRAVVATATMTVDAADNHVAFVNPAWFTNQSSSATSDEGPLSPGTVNDLRTNFDIRATRVFLSPHEDPALHGAYLDQAASYSDRIFVCYNGLPGKPVGQAAQWEALVRAMLTNHKARYPAMQYIEPWNEPNISVGGSLPPAEYYAYYAATYRAVNDVNAQLDPAIPLQVGGPVTTHGIGSDPYLTQFLDLYAADTDTAKRLDFVSFHDYGSKSAPKRVQAWKPTVRGWLAARGIPDVPVVVSEYGPYGGADGSADLRADRLVQASAMAAMGRYYVLGGMDMPMHWVLNHLTNDRKDIYVDGTDRSRTPYGNVVRMQQLQKAEWISSEISQGADANGIGFGGLATIDQTGIAVLSQNYQAQNGTQTSSVAITVTNLPPAWTGNPIRVLRYLVDTAHNNHDYDPSVVGLTADFDQVQAPASSVTHSLTLEPNAVALLVLRPG